MRDDTFSCQRDGFPFTKLDYRLKKYTAAHFARLYLFFVFFTKKNMSKKMYPFHIIVKYPWILAISIFTAYIYMHFLMRRFSIQQ